MTEVRFVRRNRVDERFAAGAALVAACLALMAPASPTGSPIADGIVVAFAAAGVTWSSASAPWWAVATACGISAAIALDPIVATVAFLGFLAGLHVGVVRRNDGVIRSVAGAVAVNTLLWSELEGFFGLSAIIGIATCSALVLLGARRRPSRIRRAAWQTLGVVGGIGVIAVVGAGVAGAGARGDLSSAASTARAAVSALNSGDYDGAAALFDDSSRRFDAGARKLDSVIATPAQLAPGLAQNVDAGRTLAVVAADATATASEALREIDIAALTLNDGRIDVDAVAAVEGPLLEVERSLVALEAATDRVQSPWLVEPLQDQLDTLEEEIAENVPRLQNSIDAVRLAPGLLGADGERRYLVLFTSPAEARGTAGFFGNWAELVAERGELRVDDFGRTRELNAAVRENGSDCDGCSEEFLTYYGDYGFTTGPAGSVGDVPWSNITSPTHFPHAAEAAVSLYPDSGGRRIDGVIAMDPYVLAELMRYTGSIEVPELDVTVAAADAAEFLLADQYELANASTVRADALETLGLAAITRFLTADLPDPAQLADDFGPLVDDRRLLMWTTVPAERGFLARNGLLGDLPALDPTDGGFTVTATNGSANKIETFLERNVTVTEQTGPGGQRQLVADVTFTNGAPTSGLPDYVIGNTVGLPPGSSRLIVTFFGASTVGEITADGDPLPVASMTEAGWSGYRTSVDLLAGETVSYRLAFDLGADDDATFDPTLIEQPLRR